MANYLDIERLAQLLKSKQGKRGLRGVAQEIGNVSASTLSRIEAGKLPDIETVLVICDWLGISAAGLFKNTANETGPAANVLENIVDQLEADKSLDPTAARILTTFIRAVYKEHGVTKKE